VRHVRTPGFTQTAAIERPRSRGNRSYRSTVAFVCAGPSGTTASAVRSHPPEDLPPLHPGEKQPKHQERGGALEERLEARAEEFECAGAEVSDEGPLYEAFPEMGQKIGGNRFGADGRKRPRLALPAPDATKNGIPFNQPIRVGGWELIFRPGRNAGDLPALVHALPLE